MAVRSEWRPKLLRISQVGLRGVVGDGLTAAHVLDFACAFGSFLKEKGPVVVARDPRASSVMLREGVVAGLMACGREVIDLGIVSTPVLQMHIRYFQAAGGVSIGASHNEAEWNALKFFGPEGIYLSTAESNELLDIYHLRKFEYAGWAYRGRLSMSCDALDRYVEALGEQFDLAALRGFRILVDCCNGTSGPALRKLRERYGLDIVLVNERMEGVKFAHEPSTSERVAELQLAPLMKVAGADAGFLFDVDSDRLGMATEEGEAVSPELILPIIADYLLGKGRGRLVITNLSTTALVDEVAAKHGAEVVRIPVGRQAASDALRAYRREEIVAVGEGTGAVMLPQVGFAYDGIASMLMILQVMQERQVKLSELVHSYPKYSILKGELPLVTPRIPELMMALQERYGDGVVRTDDGLRVDWPGRWLHVRVSQTEPIIRVICEQRGGPPRELFEEVMDFIREYL